MTTAFEAWEIPTGGAPPPVRVHYEERDGRQLLVNVSAWMLLIRRASGAIDPVGRHSGAWLDAGDELLSPVSRTEPVDSKVVFRAQLDGIREHGEASYARLDDEGNIRTPAPEPERWWWYRRELPYGRVIHLHQASSNARLSVSVLGSLGFEGSWCYPNHTDGWAAALGWNGEGDPPDDRIHLRVRAGWAMTRAVTCPGCGRTVVLDPDANTIRHESPMCDEFVRRVEASGLEARRENWTAAVNAKTGGVGDVEVTTYESPGARHIREYEQEPKEAHRIPDSSCPGCGAAMDYATASAGSPMPTPGDAGVCVACGTLIVLDEQLRKRRMSDAELGEFEPDQRRELEEVSAIYRARALVRPSKAGQA